MRLVNSKQQRGTVILMALMFMALAAAIAVALTFRQSINTRLAYDIAELDRMNLAADVVTDWATRELRINLVNKVNGQPQADTLAQSWAKPMQQRVQGDLIINGEIIDLNRFFDLNQLVFIEGDVASGTKEDQAYKLQVMQRLMRQFSYGNGDDENASNLLLSLKDWLNVPREDGKEKEVKSDVVIAHLPMASVSELRLVPGINSQIYQSLSQVVTVIPREKAPTSDKDKKEFVAWQINANTAKEEVLTALLNVSKPQVQSIVAARPYVDSKALSGELARLQQQVPHAAIETANRYLGVQSTYFMVQARVSSPDHLLTVYTLLKRHPDGWLQELWYSRGTP